MEMLKYHNDINKINFNDFSEKEIDVLFTLLLKARDSKEKKIMVNYVEFNNLINEKHNKVRITSYIRGVSKKLRALNHEVFLPNGKIEIFGLFDKISIDTNDKNVEFTVNEDFSYLINDLIGNFTIFDLKELVNIKGNYAKTLFRLLKQWESTKEYNVKIEDFISLLGVPKGYRMPDVRKYILKPCMAELEKNFNKLELRELKKGRSVESLKFTWKKKRVSKVSKLEDVQGIKIKKGLGEKELLEFQEVEKENNNIKKIDNIETDHQKKEKIKISKEDYEKLYKEHLKEHGIVNSKAVRIGFDKSNISKYEIIEKLEDIQQEREETTGEKKKIKIDDIGKIYEEFLKKYNSSDSPVMKKVFGDLVEKDYIIDLED